MQAGEAITPRPRPPGVLRRASSKPVGLSMAASTSSLAVPSPQCAALGRSSSSSTIIPDLDLELPDDLTAALERNARPEMGTRRTRRVTEFILSQAGGAESSTGDKLRLSRDAKGGSLGRVSKPKVREGIRDVFSDSPLGSDASLRRRQLSEAATQNTSDRSRTPSHGSSSVGPSSAYPAKTSVQAGSPQASHVDDGDVSVDSAVAEEHERDWVGGLPRDELEDLLFQAKAVIRERERDLGIAAAIGKALLDKNLSLRSKHTNLTERLRMVAGQDDASSSALSPPPNTDKDHHRSASAPSSEDTQYSSLRGEAAARYDSDDVTPCNTTGSPVKGRQFAANHLPSYWSVSTPSPAKAGPESPIDSPMGSPISRMSASRRDASSLRSRIHGNTSSGSPYAQSGEAQRQYAALMEQNDALHAQLSELQAEAETNKRAGGQRLRTLNREIEGLRLELEAATARNEELEKSKVVDHADSGRKTWQRKGRGQFAFDRASTPDDDIDVDRDVTLRRSKILASDMSPTSSRRSFSASAQSLTDSVVSDSERSELSSQCASPSDTLANALATATSGPASDEQHTLVAQLLAKIQELEDTNAAMARVGSEMDGRIGRAIEEGARIQDAYEAVERADAESSFCGDSEVGDDDANVTATHLHPGGDSSIARRRAPGNRYMIEGRRTVRAALRLQRLEAAGLQGDSSGMTRSGTAGSLTSFSVSSASSSSSAARRRRRSAGGSIRPRIRITPSFEDLESRRLRAAEEEDELLASGSATATQRKQRSRDAEIVGAALSRTLRRVLSSASLAGSVSSVRVSVSSRPSLSDISASRDYDEEGEREEEEEAGSYVDWTPEARRRLSYGVDDWSAARTPSGTFSSNLAAMPTLENELAESGGAAGLPSQWSQGELQLADIAKDRRGSDQLLLRLSLQRPSLRTLRHQSSGSSLAETVASDIADLRFSTSGSYMSISPEGAPSAMQQQTVGGEADVSTVLDVLAPSLVGDALRSATADGVFPDSNHILPLGSLRDGSMTDADSYDAIERAATRAPVIWADDEDFGKPITQSEARRLGLLESVREKRGGLLDWLPGVSRKATAPRGRPTRPALQDAQMVQEELDLQQLLRDKRVGALRARADAGFGGERPRLRSLGWREQGEDDARSSVVDIPLTRPRPTLALSSNEQSLDSETTVRALSISPARARRARKLMDLHERELQERHQSADGHLSPSNASSAGIAFPTGGGHAQEPSADFGEAPPTLRRTFNPYQTQNRSERSLLRTPSPSRRGLPLPEEEDRSLTADEGFELVEVDPRQVRPGRRGTDYFPVSRRARYKPDMVRQRVQVASAEALMWITAWIGFVSVLVFAFAVAFSRGPKTIMGPSPTSLRRYSRRH